MAHKKKYSKSRGPTFVGFPPRIQNGSKKVKAQQLFQKHKKNIINGN